MTYPSIQSPTTQSACSLSSPSWPPSPTPSDHEEGRASMVEDQLIAMLRMETSYTVDASTVSQECSRASASSSSREGGRSPKRSARASFGAEEESETARRGGGSQASGAPPVPHEEWRRKICEWSYKVVDHFKFDREVVSVAMNYFDRFLASEQMALRAVSPPGRCTCPSCLRSVDSRTFQLAAMTALYLAVKLHAESGVDDNPVGGYSDDGYDDCYGPSGDSYYYCNANPARRRRKKLKILSFVELSRGQFSPDDICTMETTMLTSLRWKVNPPTPMALVTYLLRLFPSKTSACCNASFPPSALHRHYDLVLHVLHELSRYLTELSVCLADVSTLHPPSHVAYASILISMDMLTTEALPREVRAAFAESVAHVSALACRRGVLLPDGNGMRYLRSRIRMSFLPEMLLDQCSASDEDDLGGSSHNAQQHPISIARDAGLLNMNAVYGNQIEETEIRRKGSATSIMNGNDETERRLREELRSQDMDSPPRRETSLRELEVVSEDSPVCVTKHDLAKMRRDEVQQIRRNAFVRRVTPY